MPQAKKTDKLPTVTSPEQMPDFLKDFMIKMVADITKTYGQNIKVFQQITPDSVNPFQLPVSGLQSMIVFVDTTMNHIIDLMEDEIDRELVEFAVNDFKKGMEVLHKKVKEKTL